MQILPDLYISSVCLIYSGWVGFMGHGWTGGLRSPASPVIPRHRCYPHVLLHRQSRQSWEHPREVDAGSAPFLPKRSDHSRGQQTGSSQRRNDKTRAHEDGTGTSSTGGGQGCCREDQRLLVPGVLGKDQGWRATGVWDGNAGGSPDKEEEEDRLSCSLGYERRASREIGVSQTMTDKLNEWMNGLAY